MRDEYHDISTRLYMAITMHEDNSGQKPLHAWPWSIDARRFRHQMSGDRQRPAS